MKRRNWLCLVLALCLCACLLFTACHREKNPPEPEPPVDGYVSSEQKGELHQKTDFGGDVSTQDPNEQTTTDETIRY